MNGDKVNIIIISQQLMFRKGVEFTLSNVENIEVTNSVDFSNGVEFSLDDFPPDIAILDVDGPSEMGIEMAHRIKQRLPNIGVILFTSNPNDNQLFQALEAQASAYLSKEANADELIDTIWRVACGEYPINESFHTRPQVAERVLQQFQNLSSKTEAEAFISPITPRETQILHLIAKGYLNKQIAAELEISEQTIKNHVTSILRKLNANARTEAVVIGLLNGIISLD